MISKRTTFLRSILVSLLMMSPAAQANFFTRLVKFGDTDEEKRPAPAGVSGARGSEAQVGSIVTFEDGVPLVALANNNKIPLIGFGVGNLQRELTPSMISEAMQEDKRIRLIDTSHASNNENLVTEGILRGATRMQLAPGEKVQVHVVTKVWYTHLGYERTKLSVEESIKEFQPLLDSNKIDLKLHVLLHWPRCFDNISWMQCQKEEEQLPQYVKDAGPNPYETADTAWKESWKALEDMYLSDKYPISSIGVSNFHVHDLESMEPFARIHPHILQVNIWSLLYDADLIDYCHKHRIHVQVYNAMHGTVMAPENAPRAYHHIQKVAAEVSKQMDGEPVTPAQIILAWLIQHGVSVIPRTSKKSRLEENSVISLTQIPALTDHQVETIAHAVEAYLSGDDLEQDIHVSVSFHAVNKDILIFWLGHLDEVRVAHVKKGESFHETTYPNHKFRTYDASNKDIFVDHEISTAFGEHEDIHVEL